MEITQFGPFNLVYLLALLLRFLIIIECISYILLEDRFKSDQKFTILLESKILEQNVNKPR